MIEPRLYRVLSHLESLRRKARLRKCLAAWWLVVLVVLLGSSWMPGISSKTATNTRPEVSFSHGKGQGFGVRVSEYLRVRWSHFRQSPAFPKAMMVLGTGFAGAFAIGFLERRREPNFQRLVQQLETEHPDLRPLFSTALEQRPNPETGEWHLLQTRVVQAAVRHRKHREIQRGLERKLNFATAANLGAVLLVIIAVVSIKPVQRARAIPHVTQAITVEPGDVELERGSGLVVTIRFDKNPPNDATLVLIGTNGETKRIAMERHLADPLFGASLRDVSESGGYRIEHGGKSTRDYNITVFEFPALVRADAALEFPAYTGLTNKSIPDTLRVSAVEGSRLDFTFQLNKPVAEARWVANDHTIALGAATNAVASLNDYLLRNSVRYSLHLRDAEGRTNKRPVEFVVQVLPNRAPELKFTFPRGDQRVSNLQELRLEAEASDDFGLVKYGFGYSVTGEDPKFVELGETAARNEKRAISQLIDIEKLGLQVDQVVSYFAWADDVGPDGQPRRTFSDMFFAEVRPFDEVFRPDQSGGGEGEQGQQAGGGGGGDQTRLAELQKQIVLATWKMQREKGAAMPNPKP